MSTDRERYLLKRCLRLEAEIGRLKGFTVDPAALPLHSRRRYHATRDEIARMCDLRLLGRTLEHIAQLTGFSVATVHRHTMYVLEYATEERKATQL